MALSRETTAQYVASLSCKILLSGHSTRVMKASVTRSLIGTSLVVCVSLLWLSSSFLIKSLEGDAHVSPFLISLLANSLFVAFLPLAYLRRWLCPPQEKTRKSMTDWSVFTTAALVAPFFWLGQFTFNLSLELTSVSSTTILSSTGSLFTFGLAIFFLNESFYWYKLISVVTCFAGTILVALSDTSGANSNADPLLGDAIGVCSALLYACYSIMMSKWLPGDSKPDMLLLFGYMGLVQIILFSGVGVFLIAANFVQCDLTLLQTLLIFGKGLLDNVLSDVLWIKAVILVGPTIATVGLSLQWPIALVIDALFFHPPWVTNPLALILVSIGCTLIFGGFIGINTPPEYINVLRNAYRPLPCTEENVHELDVLEDAEEESGLLDKRQEDLPV